MNFKVKICENIDESLKPEHPFHQQMTKNRSFVDDYGKWVAIMNDAPETYIYKNAVKAYQEAFGNMLMGIYQPAFMGLRYFLERTLMGVYFSGSEVELRTWLRGNRDTYWTELVGAESENKNVDKGLFSIKFVRAFFPEIEGTATEFRVLTKAVYRNCSEFVHGNPSALDLLGNSLDFSEEMARKWNDYADTVARCILYAFVMRYWHFISGEQKVPVIERVKEEFETTDILKSYIG